MPRTLLLTASSLLALLVLSAATGCNRNNARIDTHKLPPKPNTATVSGAAVAYSDYDFRKWDDPREDRAVVFIHGWSCNQNFWRLQQPSFSRFDRVLLIDLPGHGQSDKPETTYSLQYFADAVRAVMDDAGVKEAFLVGHSMGWAVTREFLKAHPERVLGVVNVDGMEIDIPTEPDARAEWDAEMTAFVESHANAEQSDAALLAMMESMSGSTTSDDLIREITDEALKTPAYVRHSALKSAIQPANWNRGYWPKTPALAIYARSDWVDAALSERMKAQFPRIDFIVWDDAGHFLMMERPTEFNRRLVEWVDKHTANFVQDGAESL